MDDRVAIFDRISSHSFDAAVRLDDEFEAQLERLTDFPQLGRAGRIAVLGN
jgi:plasmid stabilization system protein ParE